MLARVGTSRESLSRIGYRVCKLRSGLGPGPGFTRCWLDKLFDIFCFVNQSIGQQFPELWHHEDCAQKENGTVYIE